MTVGACVWCHEIICQLVWFEEYVLIGCLWFVMILGFVKTMFFIDKKDKHKETLIPKRMGLICRKDELRLLLEKNIPECTVFLLVFKAGFSVPWRFLCMEKVNPED